MTLDTLGETDPGVLNEEEVMYGVLELGNVVAGGFASSVVPPGTLCSIRSPVRREGPSPAGVARLLMTDGGSFVRLVLVEEP